MTNGQPKHSPILGWSAAGAVVLIGAGWYVVTRLGVTTSLVPIDLVLLRYAGPALLLLPIIARTGLLPASCPKPVLAAMVLGAGLPFGLLAIAGSSLAPVAHMGVLIPGGMALCVGLLSMLLGERYSTSRVVGLALIGAATATLIGLSTGGGPYVIRGDLLFLTAAAVWAIFTIAFRRSGLTPIQATAVISGWSAIFAVPVWLATSGTQLQNIGLGALAVQIVWQSLLAGVAGMWLYVYAVRSIGPGNAAAIGALLPAASTVGGYFILNETVALPTVIAVLMTIAGVLFAIGWLDRVMARKRISEAT